jgi:hypothetical protein
VSLKCGYGLNRLIFQRLDMFLVRAGIKMQERRIPIFIIQSVFPGSWAPSNYPAAW